MLAMNNRGNQADHTGHLAYTNTNKVLCVPRTDGACNSLVDLTSRSHRPVQESFSESAELL